MSFCALAEGEEGDGGEGETEEQKAQRAEKLKFATAIAPLYFKAYGQ